MWWRQGLTLVHDSAQPVPFSTEFQTTSPKSAAVELDLFSVSPWVEVAEEAAEEVQMAHHSGAVHGSNCECGCGDGHGGGDGGGRVAGDGRRDLYREERLAMAAAAAAAAVAGSDVVAGAGAGFSGRGGGGCWGGDGGIWGGGEGWAQVGEKRSRVEFHNQHSEGEGGHNGHSSHSMAVQIEPT